MRTTEPTPEESGRFTDVGLRFWGGVGSPTGVPVAVEEGVPSPTPFVAVTVML